MNRFKTILVPTDLSERSRRALRYSCWLAAEEQSSLIVLHVANELTAWELYCEDLAFLEGGASPWPLDRVVAEATLDLNRFLEPNLGDLKQASSTIKKVLLGQVAQQIVAVAEQERADLIVMSPRRHRPLKQWLFGSVIDRVTRSSPCPVLAVTPPLPSRPWRGKRISSLVFPRSRQRTVEV